MSGMDEVAWRDLRSTDPTFTPARDENPGPPPNCLVAKGRLLCVHTRGHAGANLFDGRPGAAAADLRGAERVLANPQNYHPVTIRWAERVKKVSS